MNDKEKELFKDEESTEQILEKIKQFHLDYERKYGETAKQMSEYKSFMEKATADLEAIDKKQEKRTAETLERLERIEKKVNHVADNGSPDNSVYESEKQLLTAFMRKNAASPEMLQKYSHIKYSPDDFKIASVSDDPDAGYLKRPATMVKEIIKDITEYSPVRQWARVFTTNATVKAPRRTAVATASNRAEAGSMSEETTRKYGLEIIEPHEITVRFDAYYWMLEDADFPIASEAQSDAAEAFAAKEGTAFISGTGIGEAEGVMDNSSISYRAQGETSTLTDPTALIKMAYDINDQYVMDERNCAYFTRRATLGTIRTLTDGNGRFYLENMDEKGRRRIEGFPVVTAPDMDAIGANTYPVVFGNWYKGYWIVDRMFLWILRDPYTNSDSGYETFKFRRRVGGAVVQPAAFYKLKIATS